MTLFSSATERTQTVRSADFERTWVREAIALIEADFIRSADTHLLRVPLPAFADIDLYLKDESTHPTGSLKHRLARSLFLYGLCNGWIGPRTTIIEASSGSTAVSEAYFAQMLALPFVAVMPAATSLEKISEIAHYGGRCHFVERPGDVYAEAARIAEVTGGHYMDQFTYAERATDWRGNNNIAQSIFEQMARERHPEPTWIVSGAGTGGTTATLGRFIRHQRRGTRLCLADPEDSVFHQHLADPSVTVANGPTSIIEGVGRSRLEPSFVPSLIDRSITVSDGASLGAARSISRRLNRSCGGSTGTNIWAAATLIAEMAARHESGSVVTLLCDSGDRYLSTHLDDAWIAARNLDVFAPMRALERFFAHGSPLDQPALATLESQ